VVVPGKHFWTANGARVPAELAMSHHQKQQPLSKTVFLPQPGGAGIPTHPNQIHVVGFQWVDCRLKSHFFQMLLLAPYRE
jgi:hypothetical protein